MIPLLRAVGLSLIYPAFLFSAGNTTLALGHAEILGVLLNFGILTLIFVTKFYEQITNRQFGIPFSILSITNFLTFISIEVNMYLGTHTGGMLAGHISAAAFLVWSVGHLFVALHERKNSHATSFTNNPQMYYGVADMLAVNAAGALNPLSFPFMVLGFFRSIFIIPVRLSEMIREVTAARIYGVGYLVGAATSLSNPLFAVAQVLWAVAYLRFKRDA